MSGPSRAILVDLLMATMDSISTWAAAAGHRARGMAWRDAVTRQMIAIERYVPYEWIVRDSAGELDLPPDAVDRLWDAWRQMRPWPDAGALASMGAPFAFVTNCSTELATAAVERSGLRPAFTLSAEEAGWYKPRLEIYRLAGERIGIGPHDARFVAGAAYDAIGASRAGLQSVLVARRPIEERLPPGIVVVTSLEPALAGL